jgi:hypothetical protein
VNVLRSVQYCYIVKNREPLIVLDVALARLLPLFKTYGSNPTVFWQSAEGDDSGHQKQAEMFTKIHIKNGP